MNHKHHHHDYHHNHQQAGDLEDHLNGSKPLSLLGLGKRDLADAKAGQRKGRQASQQFLSNVAVVNTFGFEDDHQGDEVGNMR